MTDEQLAQIEHAFRRGAADPPIDTYDAYAMVRELLTEIIRLRALGDELADLKLMWNEELAIRYREEYGLASPAEALNLIDEWKAAR